MSTPYYSAGSNNGAPVVVQGQVVQGTVVSPPQQQQGNQASLIPASTYNNATITGMTTAGGNATWNKEERHPEAFKDNGTCKDAFWAILFYVHLAIMVFCAVTFFPQFASDVAENAANENNGRRLMSSLNASSRRFLEQYNAEDVYDYGDGAGDGDGNQNGWQGNYQEADYNNGYADGNGGNDEELDLDISVEALFVVMATTGAGAFIVSSLGMSLMMSCAGGLIKAALWFNIILFGFMALAALGSGSVEGALMGGLGCAFSAWYAYSVWNRIPFAASNLVTAIQAVRANIGLTFFAYLNLALSFLWSILWMVSAVGAIYVLNGCDASGECSNDGAAGSFVIFLFFISYYWVGEVLKNVVHCTVAGTVGTWWFVPHEANGCCSQAVRESYWRSITTSFGSICFGSLIVAIIQAIKEMVHGAREQQDGGSVLLALLECVVGCIEALIEYFNKWAFVYVGLYGYSFIDAGKNVMQLFSQRGWTAIIADVLVDTVLFMVSVGVGVLTGIIGLIVAGLAGAGTDSVGTLMAIGFVFGLFLGFVVSTILFGIISSAVNTVIVCFAEAPNEFQVNHPQLSQRMRESWRMAYPGEYND